MSLKLGFVHQGQGCAPGTFLCSFIIVSLSPYNSRESNLFSVKLLLFALFMPFFFLFSQNSLSAFFSFSLIEMSLVLMVFQESESKLSF
jgi:hypothetical protein